MNTTQLQKLLLLLQSEGKAHKVTAHAQTVVSNESLECCAADNTELLAAVIKCKIKRCGCMCSPPEEQFGK